MIKQDIILDLLWLMLELSKRDFCGNKKVNINQKLQFERKMGKEFCFVSHKLI